MLLTLVILLMVFLVTYVVPNFAALYSSMEAKLPLATEILIAVGTTARSYVLLGFGILVLAAVAAYFWSQTRKLAGNARPLDHAFARRG